MFTFLLLSALSIADNMHSFIDCGITKIGYLEMYEEDFFKFELHKNKSITIDNCGSQFDTELTIYNLNKTIINQVDDSNIFFGDGTSQTCNCHECNNTCHCNEIYNIHLNKGIYYIGISGWHNNYGNYSISIKNCLNNENNVILYKNNDNNEKIIDFFGEYNNITNMILIMFILLCFLCFCFSIILLNKNKNLKNEIKRLNNIILPNNNDDICVQMNPIISNKKRNRTCNVKDGIITKVNNTNALNINEIESDSD